MYFVKKYIKDVLLCLVNRELSCNEISTHSKSTLHMSPYSSKFFHGIKLWEWHWWPGSWFSAGSYESGFGACFFCMRFQMLETFNSPIKTLQLSMNLADEPMDTSFTTRPPHSLQSGWATQHMQKLHSHWALVHPTFYSQYNILCPCRM